VSAPTRFNLSAWALEHRSFTGYLIVACLVAGALAYFRLGQKEDPEFTFRVMVVRAFWPGATAREVEQQVTDKIEKKLQETPYLDYLRSYSRAGEATIFVNLKESTPPREVAGIWYQVRKKVGDIRGTLPQEVVGPYFNDEFGDTFGSIYAFSADGFSYADLKKHVDFVRQELLRLPGVAKVDLLGVQDEKIYIEYSNRKIAQLGIDPPCNCVSREISKRSNRSRRWRSAPTAIPFASATSRTSIAPIPIRRPPACVSRARK
jgi:multidrug efflux pump